MAEQVLHGLIQWAKLGADGIKVKAFPGGKGFRLWRQTEVGWDHIADMKHARDVEDFLVAQLSQVEPTDAPR
jgi:hypothetical protein